MGKLFTRLFVVTLLLCMVAGQSAAYDLRIGRMDFTPMPAGDTGPRQSGGSAVGAMITIPFGDAGSRKSTATLNGMEMTRFTRENAKDAFISTMLIATFVALGVLSVSAMANSIPSD